MNIHCINSKTGSQITFDGELTIYAVANVKQELFADFENIVSPVSLDLEKVSEIDTAGIQLILFFHSVLNNTNKKLYIKTSNEQVDNLLSQLNIADLLTVSH